MFDARCSAQPYDFRAIAFHSFAGRQRLMDTKAQSSLLFSSSSSFPRNIHHVLLFIIVNTDKTNSRSTTSRALVCLFTQADAWVTQAKPIHVKRKRLGRKTSTTATVVVCVFGLASIQLAISICLEEEEVNDQPKGDAMREIISKYTGYIYGIRRRQANQAHLCIHGYS